MTPRAKDENLWSVWILAGGESSRMGRDKSRLVVSGRTLLQHARGAALELGVPVRTVRKDCVPKCGPLGGILTGLRRARVGWCLFLTCDMPMVSTELLRVVVRSTEKNDCGTLVVTDHGPGFPLALRADAAADVEWTISSGKPSLRRLAERLGARELRLPRRLEAQLANVNRPEELIALRRRLKDR